MLISRLGLTASSLCKINRPTCLLMQRNIKRNVKYDVDVDDQPIPYSTSEAAKWKAEYARAPPDESAWFTPYVVSGSLVTFLLYFCVLREENDIDEILYRPLPETLKGIEKKYPNFDFYIKPDYIQYYEEKKKLKNVESKS